MGYEVVVSQGRVADRTAGALMGAALTGAALGECLGVAPTVVGTPSAPHTDDWSVSLPAATAVLTAHRDPVGPKPGGTGRAGPAAGPAPHVHPQAQRGRGAISSWRGWWR